MRWAVVTGASSGIGLEFARQLAKKRFSVVMVSNQARELESCAEHLRAMYFVEAYALPLDLCAKESVDAILAFLEEKGIVPEVLVNNAGIFDFKPVSELPEGRVDLYIDLHVRAVTALSVAVGRIMAQRRHGYILNMSSMSCWMPMPGIAMYSATKAYMRAFSRAFRIEMKDSGVSVTVARRYRHGAVRAFREAEPFRRENRRACHSRAVCEASVEKDVPPQGSIYQRRS